MSPQKFQIVLVLNEYGDFLSDMACGLAGSLGIGASANLGFDAGAVVRVALFDAAHGTAPDIAGKNIANPVAMIWSAAMMLDFLGKGEGVEHEAHDAILGAIEAVLKEGPHTADLGGRANTTEVGKAIAARLG